MIKLKNISVIFKTDDHEVQAVKDVNLTVEKKDIYGIIGYSGAGKSTLVRVINLLQNPTQGDVEVNGINFNNLSKQALRQERKKIGMIFQHFNLMNSLSVFENVAFPLKNSKLSREEIKRKVYELLELVGLEDKVDAYPRQLSGGQKQRVAIARSLANDPHILLCDEATSALDPKTTDSILDLLKMLNAKLGITIVIITHEMRVVKEICNKVAIMENGKVIEQGSILEIFTAPKQDLTKDFIDTATNFNKGVKTILTNKNSLHIQQDDVLAKISFVGEKTGDPLISNLTSKYSVATNILFGNVEMIQNTAVGTLFVGFKGEASQISEAVNYLQAEGVNVVTYNQEEVNAWI